VNKHGSEAKERGIGQRSYTPATQQRRSSCRQPNAQLRKDGRSVACCCCCGPLLLFVWLSASLLLSASC
jgi:hypothetical protein